MFMSMLEVFEMGEGHNLMRVMHGSGLRMSP